MKTASQVFDPHYFHPYSIFLSTEPPQCTVSPGGQSRRLSDPSSFPPHRFAFAERVWGLCFISLLIQNSASYFVYTSLIPKIVMEVRMHCFLVCCIDDLALVSRGALAGTLFREAEWEGKAETASVLLNSGDIVDSFEGVKDTRE